MATIIKNLEDLSIDEVMEQFSIGREPIQAALEFVAQSPHTPQPACLPVYSRPE